MFLWRTEDFHDAGELLPLILTREDWVACQELGEDAPKGPHVDGHTISHAEYDFGRPIEAGLYVGIDLLILETTGAEIDNFDLGTCWMGEEDILRLKITMDDLVALQQDQAAEKLFGKAPD